MNKLIQGGRFAFETRDPYAVMPLPACQMEYGMPEDEGQAENKVVEVSTGGKRYTMEELEYLATMHIAEKFGLPNADLLAIAAENPPPPAWFKTKEEKPF